MFCKSIKNRKIWKVYVVIGIITIIFSGLLSQYSTVMDTHNGNMLIGMFSGLGSALLTIGIVNLIRSKRIPEQKLRKQEIELKDERNIQIIRLSYSVGNMTATLLLAIIAFIFVGMNYIMPAVIAIGAMYVQWLAVFIAGKYYSKKI